MDRNMDFRGIHIRFDKKEQMCYYLAIDKMCNVLLLMNY